MKNKIFTFLLCNLFIAIYITPISGQYVIKRINFSNGFGGINGPNNAIYSNIGQTFIGKTADSSFVFHAGFWFYTDKYTSLNWPDPLFPIEFKLSQNYPNPFNPVTKIAYTIPISGNVRIDIHNILGQHITTLVDAEKEKGYHVVGFSAANLASGIYIYSLRTNDYFAVKKMIVTK